MSSSISSFFSSFLPVVYADSEGKPEQVAESKEEESKEEEPKEEEAEAEPAAEEEEEEPEDVSGPFFFLLPFRAMTKLLESLDQPSNSRRMQGIFQVCSTREALRPLSREGAWR